jgi:hypothetical protein
MSKTDKEQIRGQVVTKRIYYCSRGNPPNSISCAEDIKTPVFVKYLADISYLEYRPSKYPVVDRPGCINFRINQE